MIDLQTQKQKFRGIGLEYLIVGILLSGLHTVARLLDGEPERPVLFSVLTLFGIGLLETQRAILTGSVSV